MEEEAEYDEKFVELGSVWTIGNVTEKTTIATKNRYESLEEDEAPPGLGGHRIEEVPTWRRKNYGEKVQIMAVQDGRQQMEKVQKCEITVDSGAEGSVWPEGLLKEEPTVKGNKKKRFITASGHEMNHFGKKQVKFIQPGGDRVHAMNFEVTEVTKPLVAVRRIVENGNRVVFGDDDEDGYVNYIQNKNTGARIPMREKGGSYVIDVELLAARSLFSGLA